MAHSCPDCYQSCHCTGDIEDHDTGDEIMDVCDHCDGEDDDLFEDQDDAENRVYSDMQKVIPK